MKTIILCLGFLFLTSCGGSSSSSKPVQTIDPLADYHKRPLPITQKETVSFTRQKQRTIRYNCADVVVTDQLETINQLSKKLTVDFTGRKDAWDFTPYNRTTKSANRGAFVEMGQFVINYSPTVFHMTVNEGMNDVEYVFRKCLNVTTGEDGYKKCAEEDLELMQEGIVQVEIFYSQVTIPGERIFKPSEAECKPKA